MANIAVLIPREYMRQQAVSLLNNELNEMLEDIHSIKVVETAEALNEARNAINEGVHVIVARGLQAQVIKEYTNIPVAEITVTAQDLGLLMLEAKKLIKKPVLKVALIASENMLSDTTHFNQLFNIDLAVYRSLTGKDFEIQVETAVRAGADLIIGGDVVNRISENYKIPSLFLESTEDSIRNALQIARKMSYTSEVERHSNAQFATMLDTAFNGIIKIDKERTITAINRVIEELLESPSQKIIGNRLEQELSEISQEYVNSVLNGKRDIYSTSIKIRDIPVMVIMAPIQYDQEITGAILSCQRLENTIRSDIKTMQARYLSGYIAKTDFSRFYSNDETIKQNVELAKKYSLSDYPVLIYGEAGTEKEQFAQGIHNNSARKNGPFVSVNCGGLNEESQKKMLFGDFESQDAGLKRGALRMANYGTLYIGEVEQLGPECQYRLFKMIQHPTLIQNDIGQNQYLDVRIILSAERELSYDIADGNFRKDLYYSINALSLHIPPLRQRQEDIQYLVKNYLKNFAERYGRYLKLSTMAMTILKEYPWAGNEIQIENFCERLFLTSSNNTISEGIVRNLLNELYPELRTIAGAERIVVYQHPESEEITKLLAKHHGSRNKVAKELGISTTTLWRRMKKFGIIDN